MAVLVLGLTFATLLSSCSQQAASENEISTENAPPVTFYTDDELSQLAPGIYILRREHGFHLRLYPRRFKESSIAELKALEQKLTTLIPGSTDLAGSQIKELLTALSESKEAYAILSRNVSPIKPSSISCSAHASAMPTSAQPGAKAYATASCGWYAFNAQARTGARAGSVQDNDFDSGIRYASTSSVAYLPPEGGTCSSYGSAAGYIQWGSLRYLDAYDFDSNGSCY